MDDHDETTWFKSMNVFMPPKALLNKQPGFRTTDESRFFKVSKWLFSVLVLYLRI
jgi:hypothetical protein